MLSRLIDDGGGRVNGSRPERVPANFRKKNARRCPAHFRPFVMSLNWTNQPDHSSERKKYEHCDRRTTHPKYGRLQRIARTRPRTRTAAKVCRRMGVRRRGIHGPGTATDETQGGRKLPFDRRVLVRRANQKHIT